MGTDLASRASLSLVLVRFMLTTTEQLYPDPRSRATNAAWFAASPAITVARAKPSAPLRGMKVRATYRRAPPLAKNAFTA